MSTELSDASNSNVGMNALNTRKHSNLRMLGSQPTRRMGRSMRLPKRGPQHYCALGSMDEKLNAGM